MQDVIPTGAKSIKEEKPGQFWITRALLRDEIVIYFETHGIAVKFFYVDYRGARPEQLVSQGLVFQGTCRKRYWDLVIKEELERIVGKHSRGNVKFEWTAHFSEYGKKTNLSLVVEWDYA